MSKTITTFGGGCISPSVAAHLSKPRPQKPQKPAAKVPATNIGGGCISPSVKRHLSKS